MKLIYTTPKELEKIITSLKSKNSYGYDGNPMKILKVSIPFITSPLTYICNKSLLSGIFPSQLKFSEIKPLHKKGDRMDITSFRPISLLTSFSKILEKSYIYKIFNPLNAELNSICYFLALLGPHSFLHVSRIRVNVAPCMLPHLLYNPTHALFTL